jgi:SAM-dependent methyltransferase
MHASSMENMRRCLDWYGGAASGRILDLGAMDVNGSYRQLFASDDDYVGIDLEPGPGVDVVLTDVYQLPFEDSSAGLVLSGQMIEHCGQFWRVFSEISRVLKPGGLAFVIAPSSGPVHRYPVDCYRFYPDSYQAIADWAGLRLVHSWTDQRGPWRDIVGVFQKGGSLEAVTEPRSAAVEANCWTGQHDDAQVETRNGERRYVEVLRDLHAIVKPKLYLEIGVRKGSSLALANCPAVAVDPDPHPQLALGDKVQFYRCTSDDFFFFHAETALDRPVGLAFIDGMHLAEFVYRDFMNVERVMHRNGVIVVDDVFPNHPVQASRTRQSQVWTGDVWRFAEALAEKRPDLKLTWFDTEPSGLLVISRLNPKSRAMWEDYNKAIRRLDESASAEVPETVLRRERAVEPTIERLRAAAGR